MASPTSPPLSRSAARGPDGIDRPAATACTECRRKHVRCDATTPICLRCTSSGAQCIYLPSRRGLKRHASELEEPHGHRQANRQEPHLANPSFVSFVTSPITAPLIAPYIQSQLGHSHSITNWPTSTNPPISSTHHVLSPPSPVSTTSQEYAANNHNFSSSDSARLQDDRSSASHAHSSKMIGADVAMAQDDETLVNLYYSNFHAAHPFLVPRTMFASQNYPDYLVKMVQFVGSHYTASSLSNSLREAIGLTLAQIQEHDRSFHIVQARLLFSIVLHARNEIRESVSVLAEAVTMALEIGLQGEEFCSRYGPATSITAESVRRTWWELYVIDGFTAALQRRTGSLCHDANPDMPLPCEENLYMDGSVLSTPPTVAEFDTRIFAEEEYPFSSFYFRIEAVRNLLRVLAISGDYEVEEEQVQAINTTLAAWAHHLPADKASALNEFGEVDEMLFQAHMFVHYTIIYLHFPRSHLVATVPATSEIIRQRHLVPFSTQSMHGLKAIEAAKQLANLAALHASTMKRTPFFVFAVVFGAIVQLSAFSQQALASREHFRDRISLIMGILKSSASTWTFSGVVLRKLRKIAAEVLDVKLKEQHNGAIASQEFHASLPHQDILPAFTDMDWLTFFDTGFLSGMIAPPSNARF